MVIALSLGGVLASAGKPPGVDTLANIFQFHPIDLLTAAVFGLTPNVVMQKLKIGTEAAEESEMALQKTGLKAPVFLSLSFIHI